MDEAGRTTQPPLIMAPPSLKADPDGEATDTIVDNGIMSSSRMRTGSSRSGASQRVGGANGESSSGDAATETSAATAEEDTAEAGSSTTVPLPAETIGKGTGWSTGSSSSTADNGRSSERQGSRQTMTSGDSTWLADQETGTAESADSAGSATPSASAAPAANGTSTADNDRKPSFTPAAAAASASCRAGRVGHDIHASVADTVADRDRLVVPAFVVLGNWIVVLEYGLRVTVQLLPVGLVDRRGLGVAGLGRRQAALAPPRPPATATRPATGLLPVRPRPSPGRPPAWPAR